MAIKTVKKEVPDRKFKHLEEDTTLEVYREQHPHNPRMMEQMGTMICSHKRYSLGDEQFDSDRFNGWSDLKRTLLEDRDAWIVLPIYMLDHSIQTVSTTPFNNQWDSGQVGFIYTTKERLKEFGHDVEELEKNKVRRWLKDEVERYDHYLRGDVYRFELLKDGTTVDRCGGFMGDDLIDQIFENSGLDRDDFMEVETDV